MHRLAAISELRHASPTASVRRDADTPALFSQIRQPSTDNLVVPEVSSERRRCVPIGFLTPDVIVSNMLYVVPSATLLQLGVLISNVHMAWMRIIAGGLKSNYRYTPAVYNNFPWLCRGAGGPPAAVAGEPPALRQITAPARAILDARAALPGATLADLYAPLTMPPDLLAAHRANDRAVMAAYGFDGKLAESDCVAELFKFYGRLAD